MQMRSDESDERVSSFNHVEGSPFSGAPLVAFRIDGRPAGKGRHRSALRKGKVFTYNKPSEPAASWLDVVLWMVRTNRPAGAPFAGELRVDLEVHLPRPKRLMRKSDPAGAIPAPVKPDRDNADKLILDAMTQAGWWCDDCQVTDGYLAKRYHAKGEIPHAVVRVWTLQGAR